MTADDDRFPLALLSLYGLATADALGQAMFGREEQAHELMADESLPPAPWWHTDDTEMAISVVETLREHGAIERDALAQRFLQRFRADPDRGYGSGAKRQFHDMAAGVSWREAARNAFGGEGSLGNGSAMRVAPLGGWFEDDLDRLVSEARNSAMVTHLHTEGVAGAIAVATAAAMAWRLRGDHSAEATKSFFAEVHRRTPEGETRRGLAKAFEIRSFSSPVAAAKVVGNGSGISCPDTVPFTIWAAAKYRADYRAAISATVSVGGDIDTNCAIVGGIVALSVGWEGLPAEWIERIEPLPFARPCGSACPQAESNQPAKPQI